MKNRKRIKLLILHFYPIELYPPILNIINYFGKLEGEFTLHTITTKTSIVEEYNTFKIIRIGLKKYQNKIAIQFNYLLFNIISLLKIIFIKPDKILYIETHSSFPVYVYKRFLNKKCEIFIHYHELSTKAEYKNGMLLVKFFHKAEGFLYQKARWISQTNEKRLEIFESENIVNKETLNTLANYPPEEWFKLGKDQQNQGFPLKIIYVGSFASFETLYIREFLTWVKKNKQFVLFDIYSFYVPDQIRNYIKFLDTPNITVYGSLKYFELPTVLKNYNIGVILYKTSIISVTHSISNKLFEYVALGLDVWFPEEILGSYKMIEENEYPRILKIDFKRMEQFKIETIMNNRKAKKDYSHYNCNSEILKLYRAIIN